MSLFRQGLSMAAIAFGVVGQAQGNDMGVLASDHLAVAFSPRTGGIASVKSLGSNHEFVHPASEKPLLWRLVLRGRDGTEMVLDNTQAGPPDFELEGSSLAVLWKGVELSGSEGILTVRVTCELARKDDTARLRLWVQNDSRAFGLWNVQFPVIAPLVRSGESQVAMGRGSWGVLYSSSQTVGKQNAGQQHRAFPIRVGRPWLSHRARCVQAIAS